MFDSERNVVLQLCFDAECLTGFCLCLDLTAFAQISFRPKITLTQGETVQLVLSEFEGKDFYATP